MPPDLNFQAGSPWEQLLPKGALDDADNFYRGFDRRPYGTLWRERESIGMSSLGLSTASNISLCARCSRAAIPCCSVDLDLRFTLRSDDLDSNEHDISPTATVLPSLCFGKLSNVIVAAQLTHIAEQSSLRRLEINEFRHKERAVFGATRCREGIMCLRSQGYRISCFVYYTSMGILHAELR